MNITEETIDSFLRGDLSAADLTAFNNAVAADTKLQQEVSLQQEIIDSVKQHRHQQLKNRLNAIDVKPVGLGMYSLPYFKLIASMGVVALIVGAFSFFNNTNTEENSSVIVESSAIGKESTDKANETASSPAFEKNKNPNIIIETTLTTPANERANSKLTAAKTTDVSKSTNSTNQNSKSDNSAKVTSMYEDLSEEAIDSDNTIEGINDNFTMPAIDNDANTSNISSPQIKVSIVKENNLGYRFFNNQLFLHGNFSNSTYELFELNNKPSKQLFLYFENNYYELIQGKTKVTSLTPITDKAILVQLTQLREH